MSASDMLRARRVERDALLNRAVSLLQADERVCASWLYGSLGRGTADDWSDLDLWVVVADEHLDDVREKKREYVARLGEPLLVVDAQQNAPEGGAFLTVVYRGEHGPLHVDWTWQPLTSARVPYDVRLLFNRGRVPDAEPPSPLTQTTEERVAKAAKQTAFFWMMVPVTAKYIARRQPWTALNLLNMLRYVVDEVDWVSGRSDELPLYDNKNSAPPPVKPAEQLAYLRELAEGMERAMGEEEGLEDAVPADTRIEVYRLVDLADAVTKEM